MAIAIERMAELRPYVYHLTSSGNVESIKDERQIDSAESILRQAEQTQYLRRKRRGMLAVQRNGHVVDIRDQDPLHEGNIDFESGWTFGRFISLLNSMVFFWPGNENGPIDYGQRHYERYAEDDVKVLRIPTADIVEVNDVGNLKVCRYNSGSPRCTGGTGSPRGSRTFLSLAAADFTPGQVKEVVFVDGVKLPEGVEVAENPSGPWRQL